MAGKAMKKALILLPLVIMAGFSGCSGDDIKSLENPFSRAVRMRTGKVVSAQPAVAMSVKLYIPRVVVESSAGKTSTIDKLGNPFYVLAFVELPGSDPAYIHPAVKSLGEALSLDNIDVVQITLPGPKCDLQDIDLDSIAPPQGSNVLRFFDPQRHAWAGWHCPVDGSVNIINCMPIFPVVAGQYNLDQHDAIMDKAEDLQQQWNEFEAETSGDTPEN